MSISKLIGEVFEFTGKKGATSTPAEEAIEKNVREAFLSRFGDVTPTREAVTAVQRNVNEFGLDAATATEEQLFRGVTGASTYKGNILTQAFNTDGGIGAGGLIAGTAVGMLGAAAVGGDAKEGAVIGGLAGLGIQGAGRAIMKNIGSVEENFMNSLLKNQTIKGGGELIPESLEDVAKRQGKDNVANLTMKDLQDAGYGKMNPNEIFNSGVLK